MQRSTVYRLWSALAQSGFQTWLDSQPKSKTRGAAFSEAPTSNTPSQALSLSGDIRSLECQHDDQRLYAKRAPDPRLRSRIRNSCNQDLMAPSAAKSKDKANSKSRTKSQPHKKGTQAGNCARTDIKPSSGHQGVPFLLQQAVLDTFARSFDPQDANVICERIQAVKGHLYNRDFVAAWETLESQEAYCLRWSPSRALAYLELLCTIPETLQFLTRSVLRGETLNGELENIVENESHVPSFRSKITCIGGGAGAEAVAFAAAMRYAASINESPSESEATDESEVHSTGTVHIDAIDIASWFSVIAKLKTGIKDVLCYDQPDSSTRESASQSDESTSDPHRLPKQTVPSFTPPMLDFHHSDILALPTSSLAKLVSGTNSTPPLVTILFTLNELYSTSMSRTTTFLLNLTTVAPSGTLLLVVDSPGSYSTVTLGGTEKRYPMQWMLDHTLLQQASKTATASTTSGVQNDARKKEDVPRWEKVGSEESRWWRMERDRLKYRVAGVQLEDMRMQWHLYRRI